MVFSPSTSNRLTTIFRRAIGFAVAIALLHLTTTAAAETGERDWYGWQPMISDGASASLMIGGTVADSWQTTTTGIAGYIFTAPIIHGVHAVGTDNYDNALLSIVLRLGLPIVPLSTALVVGQDLGDDANASLLYRILGSPVMIGLGMAAAMVIDWFVLSYETVDDTDDSAVRGLHFQGRF